MLRIPRNHLLDHRLGLSVASAVGLATEAVGAGPETEAGQKEREIEIALMSRVRSGDVTAFSRLVERHMRRAQRVAAGLVGSLDDGFDLSQEAFVRAFRARHRLDPERPFYPWYYQILRRLCFNFVRDRGRRLRRTEEAAPWLVDDADQRVASSRPDRDAERAELRRRLAASIEALPEHERETFVLKEFDGLRYKDIASWLDIPLGTVMSRLYSARRRLAAMLDDFYDGDVCQGDAKDEKGGTS